MTDPNLIVPTPHPTRADALKNRALLLDTARRLFARYGVEAVSMSAIAEAAGVGKGTLYRHFESKTQLCQTLLDDEQRALQERTFAHLRAHPNPLDNLRWFLKQVLAFVDRNAALLCVGASDRPRRRRDSINAGLDDEPPALFSSLEHPAHLWWRQTIRGLLGQMNLSGDLDYLADALYVLLDVHTIYFQRRVLGYSQSRILDGLNAILSRLAL